MSTVQANLFVTVGGDTGAMKLPVGTTAERPNAPQNGYFRFNTEDKALEYYANSQWKQIVGTKKGSSPASAFDSLNEVAGAYTGKQVLWTTAGQGSNIMPFKVLVDFDTTGGPWYVITPQNFPGGTGNSKYCFGGAGYDMSGNEVLKQSQTQNVDIGLGQGSQDVRSLWGITNNANFGQLETGVSGGYAPSENSTNMYAWFPYFYYNHATGGFFADDQVRAIAGSISVLSSLTPWVAVDTDSDRNSSGNSNTSWNSYNTSGLSNGHTTWIRDINGNTQRMQNSFSNNNEANVFVWTRTTFSRYNTGGGFNNSNGSPSGLLTDAMIMPIFHKYYTGSGGGSGFGPYYNPSIQNRINGYLYILVK